MDFQEAIELVLARSPRPMSSTEIAEAINERELFLEWKGKPVSAALVYGRASQHFTFSVNNGLISLQNENRDSSNVLRQLNNALSHSRQENAEIVLPFLLFWARVTSNETFLGKKYFGDFTFNGYCEIEIPIIKKDYWFATVKYFVENVSFEVEKFQDYLGNTLLSSNLDQALVDIVQNSGMSKKNQSDKEFSIFFNTLIKTSSNRIGGVQHISIDSLSHIFRKIIGSYQFDTLFDPFAGSASIICDINANSDTSIYLQEINLKIAFLAWMNVVLSGFQRFNIQLADSLIYPPHQQFDLIISNPSSFGPISNVNLNNIDYAILPNTKKPESFYVQMILSRLNSNGKAIIVVPESVLSAKSHLSLREYLVNNDLLHSIITTKVELNQYRKILKNNILVLDCNKPERKKGRVLFQELVGVNLTELNVVSLTEDWDLLPETAIIIETAQMRKNDYQLVISDFFNLRRLPEGNFKLLKDLIISFSAGSPEYNFIATKKEFAVEPNCIPCVSTNDLSSSASNFILDIDNVEKCVVNSGTVIKPRDLINYEAVLVARNVSSLKPTYFDGRSSILVSWGILVLKLNTQEILPEYLISQFHEDYVKNQIESTNHSLLDINRLLRVLIKVVSLEEQENLLKDYYKNVVSKTELLVIQESKKAVESEITLLASLQHELRGQILLPLVEDMKLIKQYLHKKDNNAEPFKWTDGIIDKPRSQQVIDVFTGMEKIVDTATTLFDNMQSIIDLDKDKLNKVNINLLTYIKDEVETFREQLDKFNITVVFDTDGKKDIECKIDPKKFSVVISNFIRNSIDHGFDDRITDKYLLFKIKVVKEKQNITLDLIDNGKGFPEDFSLQDYVAYKIKSGSNGSGIGGYLVNKAIEIHDGKLEYIADDNGDMCSLPTFPKSHHKFAMQNIKIKMGVHFRVVLPILNQN